MGIDDPNEAVRKVYFEYLADRFKTDPREKQRREADFDNNHPLPDDAAAIDAAREANIRAQGTGQAIEATHAAFYENIRPGQIKQKQQRLDSTDSDHHKRMNALIPQEPERNSQVALGLMAYIAADRSGEVEVAPEDATVPTDRETTRQALEDHMAGKAITPSGPRSPSRSIER